MSKFQSKAQSAQGTKLCVLKDGAAGTALTITAATNAKPMVLSTVGTAAVGDIIVLGKITGMEDLEGQAGVVTAITPGTSVTVDIDASKETAAGTAGTATHVAVTDWECGCELKSFSVAQEAATSIDVTTLCSTAKESVQGLKGSFTVSFDGNQSFTDAFYAECLAAQNDGKARLFKVEFPPTKAGEKYVDFFHGFVQNVDYSVGVDQAITVSGSIKGTGEASRHKLP